MEKLVIQLSVGKNYKAEDYNELYADIVNISAHEVKHLRDTLEDFKKDPKLDDIVEELVENMVNMSMKTK